MMTIYQFYLFPISWYVFATIVAFIAAMLFWKRGSSTAEGRLPTIPVTWKFTGAAAIFVVVLLVFHLMNPLRPFTDYTKIYIVISDKPLSSVSEVSMDWHINQTQLTAAGFDPDSTTIQMVPKDFIYDFGRSFEDKSFVSTSPLPKGKYKLRLSSYKAGVPTMEFDEEVK